MGKTPRITTTINLMTPSIGFDYSAKPLFALGVKKIVVDSSSRDQLGRKSKTHEKSPKLNTFKQPSPIAHLRTDSITNQSSQEQVGLSSSKMFPYIHDIDSRQRDLIQGLKGKGLRKAPGDEQTGNNYLIKKVNPNFKEALKRQPQGQLFSVKMTSPKEQTFKDAVIQQPISNIKNALPSPIKSDIKRIPPSKSIREPMIRPQASKRVLIMNSSSNRESNFSFKSRVPAASKSEMPTASTLTESPAQASPLPKIVEFALPTEEPAPVKKKANRGKKYMDFVTAQVGLPESVDLKEIVSNIPKVTAKSWVAIDLATKKPLFGYKVNVKREVASLTKLMTLYTAFDICSELQIEPKTMQCKVSKYSASMIGTSAYLKADDQLTLHDLFHGRFKLISSHAALRQRRRPSNL